MSSIRREQISLTVVTGCALASSDSHASIYARALSYHGMRLAKAAGVEGRKPRHGGLGVFYLPQSPALMEPEVTPFS